MVTVSTKFVVLLQASLSAFMSLIQVLHRVVVACEIDVFNVEYTDARCSLADTKLRATHDYCNICKLQNRYVNNTKVFWSFEQLACELILSSVRAYRRSKLARPTISQFVLLRKEFGGLSPLRDRTKSRQMPVDKSMFKTAQITGPLCFHGMSTSGR